MTAGSVPSEKPLADCTVVHVRHHSLSRLIHSISCVISHHWGGERDFPEKPQLAPDQKCEREKKHITH